MNNRLKNLSQDFKKLFADWGKYYALPLRWRTKQWLLFIGFVSLVVISADFDEPIRYFFFVIHGPTEDAVCKFAHWFGTGIPTLYVFLGLYLAGLVLKWNKTRIAGLMILQSYLYSGVITTSLKSIIGRWRPAAGHGHLTFSPMIVGPNAHLSFPSGDVAVVFALAVVMAGFSRNVLWKSLWVILAVLTSLSRIYYDAHWFSDVVFSTVNAGVAGIWLVRQYWLEDSRSS